jgi:hypothetical protein
VYAEEKQDLIDAVAAVVIGDREKNLQLMVTESRLHIHTATMFKVQYLAYVQLDKARADKEKAIRVLIMIAGKVTVKSIVTLGSSFIDLMCRQWYSQDRITNFLAVNAGAPDLMDLLEEELLVNQR